MEYLLRTPIHIIFKDLKKHLETEIEDLTNQLECNEFIYNELSNVDPKDYNPTTQDHIDTYAEEYKHAGVDIGDLDQPADLYEFENLLCENLNEEMYGQQKELNELKEYLAKVA